MLDLSKRFTAKIQRLLTKTAQLPADGTICVSSNVHGETIWSANKDTLRNILVCEEKEQQGAITILEQTTGKRLFHLKCHDHHIQYALVLPNSRELLTYLDNRQIQLWDLHRGKCMHTYEIDKHLLQSMQLIPHTRHILVSQYSTITLLDLDTGDIAQTGIHTSKWINMLFLTADPYHLATISEVYEINVWDLKTGTCLRSVSKRGDSAYFKCMAPIPYTHKFVSGSSSGLIRVWDTCTFLCIQKLRTTSSIEHLLIVPYTNELISCSPNEIKLWNIEKAQCLRKLGDPSIFSTSIGQAMFFVRKSNVFVYNGEMYDLNAGVIVRSFTPLVYKSRNCFFVRKSQLASRSDRLNSTRSDRDFFHEKNFLLCFKDFVNKTLCAANYFVSNVDRIFDENNIYLD